jgi:hypothetical protein
VGAVSEFRYGSARKGVLEEWGEVESGGWGPDLPRRNIFPSFSMGNIFLSTNAISADLPILANYGYIQFMMHTHVYQELLTPKVRKRTFNFA